MKRPCTWFTQGPSISIRYQFISDIPVRVFYRLANASLHLFKKLHKHCDVKDMALIFPIGLFSVILCLRRWQGIDYKGYTGSRFFQHTVSFQQLTSIWMVCFVADFEGISDIQFTRVSLSKRTTVRWQVCLCGTVTCCDTTRMTMTHTHTGAHTHMYCTYTHTI